jgi:hypothetical protein
MQLRTSPSGPLLRGTVPGQVLTWNGTEWLPGPAGGTTAWDHVVSSLSDLPAPAAGVITLTDGSWAFKASVDVGANVVSVPSGTTVLLKGMGGFNEKVLSGSNTRVLVLEGSAYLESLSIDATAGTALELATNASLVSNNCAFTGTAQGITMSAGLWRDSLSRVTGGAEAMVMTGGVLNLSQTRFLGGTEPALAASGPDVLDVFLQGCRLSASSTNTIRWDCPGGNFYAVDSEVVCGDAGSACFANVLGLAVQFVGGRLNGNGGQGVLIDGNITRMLQLVGVQGFDLGSLVEHGLGTVRQATLQACATFSDVAVGVTWAAADLPTNGLALVGNTFDTATPLVGFDHTDVGVNSKANVSNAGLMLETAIVT